MKMRICDKAFKQTDLNSSHFKMIIDFPSSALTTISDTDCHF